jgi:hypothetical protein
MRNEMKPIPRGIAAILPQDDLLPDDGGEDAPGPSPFPVRRLLLPPQTPSPVKAEVGSGPRSSSTSSSRSKYSALTSDSHSCSPARSSDGTSPNSSLLDKVLRTIQRLEEAGSPANASGSYSSARAATTTSARSSGDASSVRSAIPSSRARMRANAHPYRRRTGAVTSLGVRRAEALTELSAVARARKDSIASAAARYKREADPAHRCASPISIPSSAITDVDTSMDTSSPSGSPSPSKVFTLPEQIIDLCSDSDDEDSLCWNLNLAFYTVSRSFTYSKCS